MDFEKIIVLDDELIIRKSLEEQLRRRRYSVATASTIAQAENLLTKDHFDLMFVDVKLPDGDGTQLLKNLADKPDSPMVVIITGYGTIESAVECMRMGAFDYIIKPFSIEQIDILLKKAQSYNQLVKVNQFLSGNENQKILGTSKPLIQLRDVVKKVAVTEATVLITGENGTGKELVANELHSLSSLSKKPFIKVNCAAVTETLIESEFFGHEKGSFTGAMQRRIGRFELANGGTILLDEIGEISPRIQVKLLRVLQEKEFERVGGNRTLQVNVRVLATTNRDLKKAVERGEFREDLYYRLNVFPIHVPPLRERAEDIHLLANEFLKNYTRKHGKKITGFTQDALLAINKHNWPGNVRELQNTIERAVILCEDNKKITPEYLGILSLAEPEAVADFPTVNFLGKERAQPLEEIERTHILNVLKQVNGNRTKAAGLLHISIRTLRNKLHQYNIEQHAEGAVKE
ncbi:MAG: sigma-54-dependent Fis family transcriptional regulator [Verrucomicrobia bacterium GWF2_51_19]|nr:MAG: sigma-54-dependent Fis family transcriptional regulator [Verrucomicrobia bacterium GWF2_51_19]